MIKFEQISSRNIDHYLLLFREVYGSNPNNLRIDFIKKNHLDSPEYSNQGYIAYDEKKPIGALGAFPVQIDAESIIQIGDAMILKEYRKTGIFVSLLEKVVERSRINKFDYILGFCNIENQGSYKGLIKSGLTDEGSLNSYRIEIKPSFISRIFRKISLKRYDSYCINQCKKRVAKSFLEKNIELTISRNLLYSSIKNYSPNARIEFNKGIVWVSLTRFEVWVGDIIIKPGMTSKSFLKELEDFFSSLGKDTIRFITNSVSEEIILKDLELTPINDNLKIMIYSITHKSRNYQFNYVDLDTF